MASGPETMDQLTAEKISQHNKSVRAKKTEDALALRDKLARWKAEKAQKMGTNKVPMHSRGWKLAYQPPKAQQPLKSQQPPKSQQPLKAQQPPKTQQPLRSRQPAQSQRLPKNQPLRKPLQNNVVSRKNVIHNRVIRRTTLTLTSGAKAVAQEVKNLASKDGHPPPAKRARQSLAQGQSEVSIAGKPPVSRRSTGGPRRGLGRIQRILSTDDTSKTVGSALDREKENKDAESQMQTDKLETADSAAESGTEEQQHKAEAPQLPAPVLSTPLSHNSRASMRRIIANLSQRSAEASHAADAKLCTGSHTTPLVAVHDMPGVGSDNHDSNNSAGSEQGQEAERSDKTFSADTENIAKSEISTKVAEGKQKKRESLTSQFRKQKIQLKTGSSACGTGKSQSGPHRRSFAGKPASTVKIVTDARSLSVQPRRSILKRKSTVSRQSAVGASPCLPDARKSASESDQTVSDVEGEKLAAGHVKFAVEFSHEGEGANYRKTPCLMSRDRKTQEGLRAKLNEWRTSKGHTPNMRHAGCFHTGSSVQKPTPCSQVKPSITVEQLSKQENTLVQEDLKKNLTTRFNSLASSRSASWMSTTSAPQTPLLSSTTNCEDEEVHAGSVSEMDVSWESSEREREEMEVQEQDAPDFDTESWDICRLESDFEKCLAAIDSGSLKPEAAMGWLDSIKEAYDDVKHYIGWYKCHVAALKANRDYDGVLGVFEQAIINNVQPAEEMAKLLTHTMKDMLNRQSKRKRGRKYLSSASKTAGSVPKRRQSSHHMHPQEVQEENMFESTTVKYSVVEITPFKKRRRATEVGDRLVPVITPVRRSARLSAAKVTSLSEGRARPATHPSKEYTALDEVPSTEKEKMLFQPNRALETLLSDDSVEQDVSQNQE